MSDRLREPLMVGGGALYLILLAWSMSYLPYDLWGAAVVVPVLLALGALLLRALFRGRQSELVPVMMIGLVVKMAGAMTRYWVSFGAYAGATDAERYHQYGARAASDVWTAGESWTSVLPVGTGTAFMEDFTALVYTVSGTSRLGGFFVFAWISFVGIALFVKAAVIAVPGLASQRYAMIVVLAPSVMFWPSSIGKEAYLFATLGVATYGIARLLSRPGVVVSTAIAATGLVAAAAIRPHISAIFAGGLVAGLFVMLLRGRRNSRRSGGRRVLDRLAAVVFLVVAIFGLYAAAQATTEQLNFSSEGLTTTGIVDTLNETTRRTSKDGSRFTPPTIDSATDWPYASIRTLVRPLPFEARGLNQLIAAGEVTLLIGLCLVSWRRLLNLPRLLVTDPYVAFAITVVLFTGLAYASFGNLGVLTRQKSLIFPFLLLLPCLPWHTPSAVRRHPAQNSSMSPSDNDQFARAGIAAGATARQVSTGPPPGNGTSPADRWAPPNRAT